MPSSREVDRNTGRARQGTGARGEGQRDSYRERHMRDFKEAVNKGYRNKAIEEFLKK